MKKYAINSIEFNYCSKSKKEDLKSLENCQNCRKLPLPSYRSKTDPEKCLCNECYGSLKMKTDDLITYHVKTESIILERLIFSCQNHGEGCEEVFKLGELDQLLLHQEKCDKKLLTKEYKKCKHCKITVLKNKVHNCLVNYINDNDIRLNQIIEIFNYKIETIQESSRKMKISFEEKFMKLKI